MFTAARVAVYWLDKRLQSLPTMKDFSDPGKALTAKQFNTTSALPPHNVLVLSNLCAGCIIGASLSEPHTSETALQGACVCLLTDGHILKI